MVKIWQGKEKYIYLRITNKADKRERWLLNASGGKTDKALHRVYLCEMWICYAVSELRKHV